MNYKVIRTDTADLLIRRIIYYLAENYGPDPALKKLDELEPSIMMLADQPNLGEIPRDPVLKRQGFRVMILAKNLVFYKIDHKVKTIIIYAVVDQRQDYLSIIRGL